VIAKTTYIDFGANIIPLKGTGPVSVQVTAAASFTATLAVNGKKGVRYVNLPKGSGGTTLEAGEEASLVVANTPAELIMYDGFSIVGEVAKGLDYKVKLTGATATA
jgi:hypothetical protein